MKISCRPLIPYAVKNGYTYRANYNLDEILANNSQSIIGI